MPIVSASTTSAPPSGAAGGDLTGTYPNPTLAPGAAPRALSFYGDGSDGAATISADTTLTRDMLYTNLTVNAGKVLKTTGRILVSGTLTNRGTIQNNGGAAVADAHGAGALSVEYASGSDGGDGVALAIGNGNPGNASAANGVGGAGGAGGGAGAQTGGAGGAPGWDLTLRVAYRDFLGMFEAINGGITAHGGGGGGGASASVTGDGGGGGGGGGLLVIFARTLDNAGGVIRANGGAGAAASGTGNAGGGGGGGGGMLALVYDTLTAGTEQASGGAGGAKIGTGIAGAVGASGVVVKLSNT